MSDILAIIPSRYNSSRFPGKPFAKIHGKFMIQRVYEQVSKVIKNVYVATDDRRILDAVHAFGGKAILTSGNHKSGTDRCAEAMTLIESQTKKKCRLVVNIQGDEPFVKPEQISSLISEFVDSQVEIASLVKELKNPNDLSNPNVVKVALKKNRDALYFSRSPIPYIRGKVMENWLDQHTFYQHLGLYGFRRDILDRITTYEPGSLEMAESLEQNRWLENNHNIRCSITNHKSAAIDTAEDLIRVNNTPISELE